MGCEQRTLSLSGTLMPRGSHPPTTCMVRGLLLQGGIRLFSTGCRAQVCVGGCLHLRLLRHLGRDGFEERLVRGAVGVAVLHPVGDALLGGREGPGCFDDVSVELRVLLNLVAELVGGKV